MGFCWAGQGFLKKRVRGLSPLLALAGLTSVFPANNLAQQIQEHYTIVQHYTIVDRGPSLVRTVTDTPGLNNHGDFAIWHPITPSSMPGMVFHGDESIAIDGLKDFSFVYPSDINDRFTVVGTVQQPQDLRFTQAFKWSNNQLAILPTLGGPYAAAYAINASGDVVGSAQTATGARHAVLWQGAQPRDLGLLAKGDYSSARDINDKRVIVGEANLVPNGKPQAFIWQAGKMKPLPNLPGGAICSAQALNNSEAIVGSCDLPNGSAHGVIWKNGLIEDLGTLGDADSPSTALDINDKGQVVGTSSEDDKLKAFLWEGGKMIDLNKTLAPNSGWLLLVASRINNNGEIVGRGYYKHGIHAFLLRPDPK
jgi:probable HAF family extracellular repeat protein